MKTMLKAVGVAAGVSFAALVLGGVATPALAQQTNSEGVPSQEVHIPVADLDLNTPEGAAKYNTRVRNAAEQLCTEYPEAGINVYEHSDCVRAVREEADNNLRQQLDQLARQGNPNYAETAQEFAWAEPAPR